MAVKLAGKWLLRAPAMISAAACCAAQRPRSAHPDAAHEVSQGAPQARLRHVVQTALDACSGRGDDWRLARNTPMQHACSPAQQFRGSQPGLRSMVWVRQHTQPPTHSPPTQPRTAHLWAGAAAATGRTGSARQSGWSGASAGKRLALARVAAGRPAAQPRCRHAGRAQRPAGHATPSAMQSG